ncbi:hypothetical protein OH77DRAFT_607845 [Trametes cingulata]|nr:hypothetical protein OH77DRAFT_607845 [Trametes cingulata]
MQAFVHTTPTRPIQQFSSCPALNTRTLAFVCAVARFLGRYMRLWPIHMPLLPPGPHLLYRWRQRMNDFSALRRGHHPSIRGDSAADSLRAQGATHVGLREGSANSNERLYCLTDLSGIPGGSNRSSDVARPATHRPQCELHQRQTAIRAG